MIEVELWNNPTCIPHGSGNSIQATNPNSVLNMQDVNGLFNLLVSEDEVWIPRDQTVHWGKRPNVTYPTVFLVSNLKNGLPPCLSNIPRGSKLCARLCGCEWSFQDLDDKDCLNPKEKISDEENETSTSNEKLDPSTFCCLGEDKSIVPFEKGAAIFRHLRVSKEIKLKLAETIFITSLSFEIGFSSPYTMNAFHPVMTTQGNLVIKKPVKIHMIANKKSFKVLEKRIGNSIMTTPSPTLSSSSSSSSPSTFSNIQNQNDYLSNNNNSQQIQATNGGAQLLANQTPSVPHSMTSHTLALSNNISNNGAFRSPSPFSFSLGGSNQSWVLNDTECLFDELSCDAGSLFASVNSMILNNNQFVNNNQANNVNYGNSQENSQIFTTVKRDSNVQNSGLSKAPHVPNENINFDPESKNTKRVKFNGPAFAYRNQSTNQIQSNFVTQNFHHQNGNIFNGNSSNAHQHAHNKSQNNFAMQHPESLNEILSELNVMQKWLDSFRSKVIDFFQNAQSGSTVPPFISFTPGLDKTNMSEENKKIIIAKKIPLDMQSKSNAALQFLFTAVRTQNLPFLSSLIQYFRLDINSRNERGNTLLHASSVHGFTEGVEWLLKSGADVNIKNPRGNTALHFAYMRNDHKIKDILERFNSNAEATNVFGQRPREMQTQRKPLKRGKEAVAMIDIVLDELQNARFPIQIWCAARFGWLDVVKIYVENFFFNVDARNSNGLTPLMIACEYGREDVVRYLLSLGSDINARDLFDRCPLHHAYMGNSQNIIQMLEIQYQADKDVKDVWNRTPAHYYNIHQGDNDLH